MNEGGLTSKGAARLDIIVNFSPVRLRQTNSPGLEALADMPLPLQQNVVSLNLPQALMQDLELHQQRRLAEAEVR